MKKTFGFVMTAAAMSALMLTGCGGSGNPSKLGGTVTANGSTSMEKVVGTLSEQFMHDNKGVTVTYDATGSGTGIQAVANKTADIGLSSRDLKPEETGKGIVSKTIAYDGIAVIVNEKSPVRDLSTEQVKDVFTGKTKNWNAFGGNGDIACIGREAGSGTRDGFESITKTKDKSVLKQELTSTGAVIAAVKSSPNAIGYASFASVEGQKGIRVITVNGVACTPENIKNGSYAIRRPFNLVTHKDVKMNKQAQAFYDYMVGPQAASLITKAGAVPTAK